MVKTLTVREHDAAHCGVYTLRYNGKVVADNVQGADIHSYAVQHGYTHLNIQRTHTECTYIMPVIKEQQQ